MYFCEEDMAVADERVDCGLRKGAERVQMRVHGQSWRTNISRHNTPIH